MLNKYWTKLSATQIIISVNENKLEKREEKATNKEGKAGIILLPVTSFCLS